MNTPLPFWGSMPKTSTPKFTSQDLYTDKSLFKAQGSVWHQSDRQAGRIPDKLRHLDTGASWSKSGSHGWVYGYGLHLVDNRVGFPKWVQIETAAVAESNIIDQQAPPHTALSVASIPRCWSADGATAPGCRRQR